MILAYTKIITDLKLDDKKVLVEAHLKRAEIFLRMKSTEKTHKEL